jgi:hypothetical protein
MKGRSRGIRDNNTAKSLVAAAHSLANELERILIFVDSLQHIDECVNICVGISGRPF